MQKPRHSLVPHPATILAIVAVLAAFQLTTGTNRFFAAAEEPALTILSQDPGRTVSPDDDLMVAAGGPRKPRVEALLRLTDGRFPVEKTVPILARATTDPDDLVRAAGEVGIQRLGKTAVPILVEMMAKGYRDRDNFYPACGAVHVLGPIAIELFPEMQKALNSEAPPIQKTALFALQNMGDENAQAMDRMIELLDSQDLNVQVGVCRVLEKLGPQASPAIDKLVVVLENGTVSSRSWAAIVLGAIGESDKHDILGLLTKRLDAFTQVEKQRAMIGLGHMGAAAQPAVEKITQLMRDPSKRCQPHAAVALWQITGESQLSLEALKMLLTTVDYKMTALEQLANMGPAAAPLANIIAKELLSDDVAIREQAAIALGKIGPPAKQTVPQLKPLLQDDDHLLRQAVSDAIAAIEKEGEEKQSPGPANRNK